MKLVPTTQNVKSLQNIDINEMFLLSKLFVKMIRYKEFQHSVQFDSVVPAFPGSRLSILTTKVTIQILFMLTKQKVVRYAFSLCHSSLFHSFWTVWIQGLHLKSVLLQYCISAFLPPKSQFESCLCL